MCKKKTYCQKSIHQFFQKMSHYLYGILPVVECQICHVFLHILMQFFTYVFAYAFTKAQKKIVCTSEQVMVNTVARIHNACTSSRRSDQVIKWSVTKCFLWAHLMVVRWFLGYSLLFKMIIYYWFFNVVVTTFSYDQYTCQKKKKDGKQNESMSSRNAASFFFFLFRANLSNFMLLNEFLSFKRSLCAACYAHVLIHLLAWIIVNLPMVGYLIASQCNRCFTITIFCIIESQHLHRWTSLPFASVDQLFFVYF